MFWWSVVIAAAAIYFRAYVPPLALIAVADVGLFRLYFREVWSLKSLDRLAVLFLINVVIYLALSWIVRRL